VLELGFGIKLVCFFPAAVDVKIEVVESVGKKLRIDMSIKMKNRRQGIVDEQYKFLEVMSCLKVYLAC
jgi:hypothetical protein